MTKNNEFSSQRGRAKFYFQKYRRMNIHNQQIKTTCNKIKKHYPQLIQMLINDLLKVEDYSEMMVGFAAGVNLDVIRKILLGDIAPVSERIFLDILGLYARVFCDWKHYRKEDPDWIESMDQSL